MNKKFIENGLISFFLIIFLGIVLNALAFLLPQQPIHNHIVSSIDSFEKEGTFPALIHGYDSTILDNNTDAWMLLMSDYDGDETFLEKAMGNYYHVYPVEDGLIGSANLPAVGSLESIHTESYARYWHGWLFFVRFLLLFFNYSGIRAVNMFVQFLLTIACFVWLERKKLSRYSFALATAVLVIVPAAVASCLLYSFNYYIILVSLLCMLRFHDQIQSQLGYPVFFMIAGMATSYFDLLSYPIATLGIPLTMFLILEQNSTLPISNKTAIQQVFGFSILWGIGYAGMWVSKWAIGSLVLRRSLFGDAVRQALLRASHTDGLGAVSSEKIGYLFTIGANGWNLFKGPYLLLFAMGIFVYCRKIQWSLIKRNFLAGIIQIIPYLLIAAMPFVWWYLLMNHSYLHNHFTYRGLAVSAFAGLCGLCRLCHISTNIESKNER